MSSAVSTRPADSAARLVVDTDVASYIFKWHPQYAPPYVDILRGAELVLSFMAVAEMRQGALDAKWGSRKRNMLEAFLADFAILHSDDTLCALWASVRNESARKGRPIGPADAWMAATALVLAVPLVTNNPKDYHHLDGLHLITAK